MEFLVYYLISGLAVGILAGLFGVGGGIVMVPVLSLSFATLGFPKEIIHHLALGTSLTCILFTSLFSFTTHWKNKAVEERLLLFLAPTILIGTGSGSYFAGTLKSLELKSIFILFVFAFAFRMLLQARNRDRKLGLDSSETDLPPRSLPIGWHSFVGFWIGFSSALVGVGGGVFTSTYLVALRYPIHRAIGTSAAVGLPIAFMGSITYMFIGKSQPVLPYGCIGYVYLPAVLGIILTSSPCAYLGARWAKHLSQERLRLAFALFLFTMGSLLLSLEFFS